MDIVVAFMQSSTSTFWNGCWAIAATFSKPFRQLLDVTSLELNNSLNRVSACRNCSHLNEGFYEETASNIYQALMHQERYLGWTQKYNWPTKGQSKGKQSTFLFLFWFWHTIVVKWLQSPYLTGKQRITPKIIFLGYVVNSLNGWSWSQLCKRND